METWEFRNTSLVILGTGFSYAASNGQNSIKILASHMYSCASEPLAGNDLSDSYLSNLLAAKFCVVFYGNFLAWSDNCFSLGLVTHFPHAKPLFVCTNQLLLR
jgi:hypothetical protein